MATVEHSWFQRHMQADVGPRPFRPHGLPDEGFTLPAPSPAAVDEAIAEWRHQCEASDLFIARTELDTLTRDGLKRQLREVIVHMIEEYARHLGHADLLREAIDGRRGQ